MGLGVFENRWLGTRVALRRNYIATLKRNRRIMVRQQDLTLFLIISGSKFVMSQPMDKAQKKAPDPSLN